MSKGEETQPLRPPRAPSTLDRCGRPGGWRLKRAATDTTTTTTTTTTTGTTTMPAAKRGRSEVKSAAAAAAGGSPGLDFKKMNHDKLRTMTQEVSASKPASSAVPVEVTVFGKHIAIARINPHGMRSKWSKFPADQIATLKALNMKGFKFEDSEGGGQSQELCVPPLSTPASPHSVHWRIVCLLWCCAAARRIV